MLKSIIYLIPKIEQVTNDLLLKRYISTCISTLDMHAGHSGSYE